MTLIIDYYKPSKMKALVGVKRVLDYAIKVRVNAQKSGVELKGLKMSMNPFDEIAVEEALKKREEGHVSEVVAISIGDKQYVPCLIIALSFFGDVLIILYYRAVETLRTAMAMGADRGIHILTDVRID